ncbi:DUF2267 domain-containing protein [Pseudochrobactrum sp. MP213Fo]|uniref:DUF2267 domain-containing protein n=1 Tax=Pseudochrobactrum sp. MP213Fo TaxID=3022250 RepID=UPI003BA2721E
MEELITRITNNVGVDSATAEKAIGLILAFLEKEGPQDKVGALIAGIPGAQALIAAADKGGFLSNMMGGVMGLGSKLMSAGLGMGEISGVAKETIAFAKEKAGAQTVDDVVNSIPGLGQFI